MVAIKCARHNQGPSLLYGTICRPARTKKTRQNKTHSTAQHEPPTSSTSLRVSTTVSGMICSSLMNTLRASWNLPSVTSLYPALSCSSACAMVYSRTGEVGGCVGESRLQLRSMPVTMADVPCYSRGQRASGDDESLQQANCCRTDAVGNGVVGGCMGAAHARFGGFCQCLSPRVTIAAYRRALGHAVATAAAGVVAM